jgi:hypothetical protein
VSLLEQVWQRWWQINGNGYSVVPDRTNPPGLDCSGAQCYVLRPWVEFFGRPQNTATIAVWAEQNRLVKSPRSRQPGDLVLYDRYGQPKYSQGPRGHVGMVSDDVNVTWESASSGGVRRYSYARLGWVWCVDMGGWLRRGAGPGSSGGGIPAPPEEEEDLTPEQAKMLSDVHAALFNPGKVGAKTRLEDIANLSAEAKAGIYDGSKPTILRTISEQLKALAAKVK